MESTPPLLCRGRHAGHRFVDQQRAVQRRRGGGAHLESGVKLGQLLVWIDPTGYQPSARATRGTTRAPERALAPRPFTSLRTRRQRRTIAAGPARQDVMSARSRSSVCGRQRSIPATDPPASRGPDETAPSRERGPDRWCRHGSRRLRSPPHPRLPPSARRSPHTSTPASWARPRASAPAGSGVSSTLPAP